MFKYFVAILDINNGKIQMLYECRYNTTADYAIIDACQPRTIYFATADTIYFDHVITDELEQYTLRYSILYNYFDHDMCP